jgi:hypothetical protein
MSKSGWHLSVQRFVSPKAGLSFGECEDSLGVHTGSRRFCVADGATEAFDSRRWARLLTKSWVLSGRTLLNGGDLAPWLEDVGERFHRYWNKKHLSWYAEEKARKGSFAAFLGIGFFDSSDGLAWQAIALGDSCLLQLRAGRLILSFPLSDETQFSYHPILMPSTLSRHEAALDQAQIRTGKAMLGDVFFLLTDAIAAWYLTALKTQASLIEDFDAALSSQNDHKLAELIQSSRSDGSLRNDDVAMVRIAVVDSQDTRRGSREDL